MNLLQSQAVGDEGNWLETIAHGIGIYFIAKGLYLGPSLIRQDEAARHLETLVRREATEGDAVVDAPKKKSFRLS